MSDSYVMLSRDATSYTFESCQNGQKTVIGILFEDITLTPPV